MYFENTEETEESRNVHENLVSLVNKECASSNSRTVSQTFSEKTPFYSLTEPGWISLATSSRKEKQKLMCQNKFITKKYEEEKEINKEKDAEIQDLKIQNQEIIDENEDLKNQKENDKKEIEHLNKTISDRESQLTSEIDSVQQEMEKVDHDKDLTVEEKYALALQKIQELTKLNLNSKPI